MRSEFRIQLGYVRSSETLTRPLYLKESYTERSNSQNGHKNSKRNSSKKSAVITETHSSRNLKYNSVLLPICSAILFFLMGRRILPQSALRLFMIAHRLMVVSGRPVPQRLRSTLPVRCCCCLVFPRSDPWMLQERKRYYRWLAKASRGVRLTLSRLPPGL